MEGTPPGTSGRGDLGPDVYERLLDAAEDALDHAELHAARAEDDYVPWAEVKADLGLV